MLEIIFQGIFGDIIDFFNESIEILKCLVLGKCVR